MAVTGNTFPSCEEWPVLCADIGGSFIHAALVGADGKPRRNCRIATPVDDFDAFVEALHGIVNGYGTSITDETPLILSIAALVDPDTGETVNASANIPCLNGHPAIVEISRALGRPVAAINDADAFALAEALDGSGRGHRIVFGAILGTGVGGGLVIDGQLVRGRLGVTGEWGHGSIVNQRTRSGRTIPRLSCGCGQFGCLDTFGGARGLERLEACLAPDRQRGSRDILAAWHAGEPDACETISIYLDLVAEPLALVANVTGASIIPLGGGLAADRNLVKALDQALRKHVLSPSETPIVVPARYREDAGLRGAALFGHANRATPSAPVDRTKAAGSGPYPSDLR